MKKKVVFLALLGLALASTSRANLYTIDGSLSDWGVTPFSHWAPNPPANYTETDNVNFYHAAAYSESYDVEAMYFDNDAQNFYFGVVSSYGIASTDLGLDLNGDMTISQHGVVTGLEYAIHLNGADMGQVVYNPTWSNTTLFQWADGWQGSPYKAAGGTLVGSATVGVAYYPTMEPGADPCETYILEVAVARSLFPGNGGGDGDLVGAHYSVWCGNDSINLLGDINTPPIPPEHLLPIPGAMILGSLGFLSSLSVGLVGRLRGRRTLL